MGKPIIFIDESGTLPDPKDRVIVVAAVGAENLPELDLIFRSVKKRRKLSEKSLELKFYQAGMKTKTLFFHKLARQQISIFLLIVDKAGRKIPDSPENFAVLCGLLLAEIIHFFPNIQSINFDRHFHRKQDEDLFNTILVDFLDQSKLQIKHVDSTEDCHVNIADMVAGATLAMMNGKDRSFYEMIKNKIVSEIKLNWPEAKRRLFKTKNLPEPVQAPIQGKN